VDENVPTCTVGEFSEETCLEAEGRRENRSAAARAATRARETIATLFLLIAKTVPERG